LTVVDGSAREGRRCTKDGVEGVAASRVEWQEEEERVDGEKDECEIDEVEEEREEKSEEGWNGKREEGEEGRASVWMVCCSISLVAEEEEEGDLHPTLRREKEVEDRFALEEEPLEATVAVLLLRLLTAESRSRSTGPTQRGDGERSGRRKEGKEGRASASQLQVVFFACRSWLGRGEGAGGVFDALQHSGGQLALLSAFRGGGYRRARREGEEKLGTHRRRVDNAVAVVGCQRRGERERGEKRQRTSAGMSPGREASFRCSSVGEENATSRWRTQSTSKRRQREERTTTAAAANVPIVLILLSEAFSVVSLPSSSSRCSCNLRPLHAP
jgi:hypothetical protein